MHYWLFHVFVSRQLSRLLWFLPKPCVLHSQQSELALVAIISVYGNECKIKMVQVVYNTSGSDAFLIFDQKPIVGSPM